MGGRARPRRGGNSALPARNAQGGTLGEDDMRNVTRSIGLFALALWLSSVTIFEPGKVTEKVLRKLVGRTEVEVVEATPGELPRGELEGIKNELKAIGKEEVRRTLEDLTSWGSRAVGYPGNRKACEYIRERFEEMGLEDVTVEEFQVTVPVDEGAELEVLSTGEKVPLYCLWPNEVRTPTLPKEGVTGELIYGGKGEFRDLNGKRVEGSIVLMDFGCGRNYINARMLGAKAVIFFAGGTVDRKQAEDKFLRVPVDIPRFWAEDGRKLLKLARSGGYTVRLRAKMEWKNVETWNVYGYLPGLEEGLIVVEAYYDAMSVVPRLAVGADQACGIVALLKVAEVLSRMRPRHSVLFLATSAHFQGLSGISHFLHRHSRGSRYFRDRIPEEERIDFKLF
ncbi:MAG TPA: M28 family peptidase, partial [Candidatus Latescibacteria bacterium]|nr:M28 family peptidase [Candidatus Latescibacterota bacterium]